MPPPYDPQCIKPRNGWVVVLAEPRKTKSESGLLYSPNESGAEKVCEGAGTVIRVGVGEKNAQLGLEKGMRVLYRGFLKHANPIDNEEKWSVKDDKLGVNGQPKTYFLMNSEDIMAILPPDIEVGIYSGRPQVPEKK